MSRFLKRKVEPFKIIKEKESLSNLLKGMEKTGFQGKNLGKAYKIWKMMFKGKTTIFLGLAGALIPAGMRKVLVYLIENRLIDCLVSTGANLFHDCHESLGYSHWQGDAKVDDQELKKANIDRIYDVFASELEFRHTGEFITKFATNLKRDKTYNTREFLYLLGKYLMKYSRASGILTSAAKSNLPIYCPAIADSSIGLALFDAYYEKEKLISFDILRDIEETREIVRRSKKTGVIYLGGGTPKNFIQQAALVFTLDVGQDFSHEFAIQITTDLPQWGGLSGCTFEEAKSWGKIAPQASQVTVNCEATIALPILVSALAEAKKRKPRERVPCFKWEGKSLEISYR